jgi:UDP-3-O-[3-hydroxymyristoyl] N-acetylglucosamine deacetylase
VRFAYGEPVRHALIDLMGDLALAGAGGNSGIPCGHVVTYNADHALRQLFVREILEAVETGDVIEFPYMMTPRELAQLTEAHRQEELRSQTQEERVLQVDDEGQDEGVPAVDDEGQEEQEGMADEPGQDLAEEP